MKYIVPGTVEYNMGVRVGGNAYSPSIVKNALLIFFPNTLYLLVHVCIPLCMWECFPSRVNKLRGVKAGGSR